MSQIPRQHLTVSQMWPRSEPNQGRIHISPSFTLSRVRFSLEVISEFSHTDLEFTLTAIHNDCFVIVIASFRLEILYSSQILVIILIKHCVEGDVFDLVI